MSYDALMLAVRVYNAPASVPRVRDTRLPEGMETLLAVTAGDPGAVAAAAAAIGRPPAEIRLAGAFFVEQILLAATADDFRVLGSNRGTSLAEIKKRRQLLLHWLHPDKANQQVADGSVDRSAFIARVTGAWERVGRIASAQDDARQPPVEPTRGNGSRKRASTRRAKNDKLPMVERLRNFLYGRGS